MLHNQISYDGNGRYIIEELSDSQTDLFFADIEQSLLSQGFEHEDVEVQNQTTEIGLVDPKADISIEYDLDEDVATLYLTDLSPTKEEALGDALNIGHRSNVLDLRQLYYMEEDDSSRTLTFGTKEYIERVNR